jgi:hypothetical protein
MAEPETKDSGLKMSMAPRVGFEPTTNRLTADCSTTELPRNTLDAPALQVGDHVAALIGLAKPSISF